MVVGVITEQLFCLQPTAVIRSSGGDSLVAECVNGRSRSLEVLLHATLPRIFQPAGGAWAGRAVIVRDGEMRRRRFERGRKRERERGCVRVYVCARV